MLQFIKNVVCYYQLSSNYYSNSIKYRVYCKYKSNIENLESIESWYCTRKTGLRTVGCCSHVASIIYYIAHGMSLPKSGGDLESIFPACIKTNEESDSEFEEID